MIYLKSYKKVKNNHKNMFSFLLIIICIIVICISIFYSDKTVSGDLNLNNNAENIIENTSKYVVGISRENTNINNKISTWGSGIIVSKNGLILTNSHVCGSKDSSCYVIFDYNNSYKGKVIWSNEAWDLAIIKIDVEFENCINYNENNQLKIGQEIYTIGNPINMSFQKTVSKGIVSGLNRNVEFEENGEIFYMNNLIQIDAAINSGSSGGALIDSNGILIGINTIKITDAELMNFAIPIDVVVPVIKQIERNINYEEARLKIWCYDKYNIYESNSTKKIDEGVLVAKVENNSNAEKAGIRVGDIIEYVDTEKVDRILDLKKSILNRNVGEKIILKIMRDKKELFINVELE